MRYVVRSLILFHPPLPFCVFAGEGGRLCEMSPAVGLRGHFVGIGNIKSVNRPT